MLTLKSPSLKCMSLTDCISFDFHCKHLMTEVQIYLKIRMQLLSPRNWDNKTEGFHNKALVGTRKGGWIYKVKMSNFRAKDHFKL